MLGGKSHNWRFKSNLLNDKIFFEKCSASVKEHLAFNDTGHVLDYILWEAPHII